MSPVDAKEGQSSVLLHGKSTNQSRRGPLEVGSEECALISLEQHFKRDICLRLAYLDRLAGSQQKYCNAGMLSLWRRPYSPSIQQMQQVCVAYHYLPNSFLNANLLLATRGNHYQLGKALKSFCRSVCAARTLPLTTPR